MVYNFILKWNASVIAAIVLTTDFTLWRKAFVSVWMTLYFRVLSANNWNGQLTSYLNFFASSHHTVIRSTSTLPQNYVNKLIVPFCFQIPKFESTQNQESILIIPSTSSIENQNSVRNWNQNSVKCLRITKQGHVFILYYVMIHICSFPGIARDFLKIWSYTSGRSNCIVKCWKLLSDLIYDRLKTVVHFIMIY